MGTFQMPSDQEVASISEILSKIEGDARPAEQRKGPREAYPVIQLAAPYADSRMPTEEMFREVRCHDISTGGISFFLPHPPDFEYAVVGLGTPPEVTYLTVRVMHHSPYAGATKGYLIGCRFLGRVPISA